MKAKKRTGTIIYHILVCGFGLLMLYPLFWMFMSSFKETNTIFTTARSLIPDPFTLENYANGWKGFAGVSFATFFKNSLFVAILGTLGTLASSACVAFGFARCQFRGKKILFGAMLASMMLPGQILMVPQYLWYEKLGWVGSFAPLIWMRQPRLTDVLIMAFSEGSFFHLCPRPLLPVRSFPLCGDGMTLCPLCFTSMIRINIRYLWR